MVADPEVVVTIEFDDLSAEQVDLINSHPLGASDARPVKGLPLWRCDFRVEAPNSPVSVAADIHFWAANHALPFRKRVE